MSKVIVVIDDDREDLELITEMLSVKKVIGEVKTFTDSPAALEYIQSQVHQLQCILCDINMPKMDGIELRKQILASAPATKQIPFVFISTSHSANDVRDTDVLEAAAFLQKPMSLVGMERLMEEIIEIAGLQRAQ